MKPKFGFLTVSYTRFRIKRELNSNWKVALTSRGNIKIHNLDPNSNEYFVISKYKDKYYIRRYAAHLDRCYRICPVNYKKVTFEGYNTSYINIEKIYGFDNYNDTLNAFIKFIENNRS